MIYVLNAFWRARHPGRIIEQRADIEDQFNIKK